MKALIRHQQVVELECDDGEIKARFTIRPLTNGENAYIRDRVVETQTGQEESNNVIFRSGTAQYLTVAFGLCYVEGLLDENERPVKLEFTKDGRFERVCSKSLDLIPPTAFDELVVKITDISSIKPAKQVDGRLVEDVTRVDDLGKFREVDNG